MKTTENITSILLSRLHISKLNTRQPKKTDPAVKELALSIKSFGQSTPAIVRKLKGKPNYYEIGAGARRSVAAAVAGETTLDCVIRDYTDKEFEELILIENLQRVNPDPKSEAKNLLRLVELDGEDPDIESIASRLGKPAQWVARRIKLLSVIPPLRKQWEKDELTHFSIQMMELLGSLPKSLQKELAEDLPWELISCDCYKELNSLIERDYSCRLGDAPFPMDDPRFYGSCGGECSNNSESSPLLFSFDEKDKKDCSRCLNTSCFFTRLNKWRTHKLTEIEKGETKLIYFTKQRSVEITREDGSTIRPIQDWQLASKCGLQLGKKSDENSRRAINLTNPDKPTNAYLVPIAKASTSTTASNTVPQDSEELKRNRFQARRWKLVYEQFCEAIRATDCEQVTADVFEVAAFFGLSYSLRHRSEEDWKGFSKRDHPQGFRGHSLSVEGKLNLQQHVWQGLKSIFISRLDHHRVIDCLDIIPEMKRISELIGYDLEKAKKEADEQIPPPKSWGEVDVHTLKKSA